MVGLVSKTVVAVNNAIDGKVGHNLETAKMAVQMLREYYKSTIGDVASLELVKGLLISIKHTRGDAKCNNILLECLNQFD